MIKKLFNILPILVLAFLVIILVIGNIIPNTFFTGWDNLHPEFNLLAYTKKIVFGAWANYQGLGAPAAQAQLSEITRLPFIFILDLFLPKSLVRYVFHFIMFFFGGVGIFLYLKKYWLTLKDNFFQNLIALIGAFYYLLNIYTLQQFYISFELFIVQFAFLPFLLISIHHLIENKKILSFILFNLLISPSGHTPTVFYLSWCLATLYSFFLTLKNNGFLFSLKKSISVFLLIFFLNSYWIIPNLYYTLFNSRYVVESRSNQLFNQESKWSIVEAGNWKNIITGIHYLFLWKDFKFQTQQYEYIFQEWVNHFNQPLIIFFLIVLNILSLFGIFYSLANIKKNINKLGLILFHLVALIFIWMGIFLPQYLVKFFYSSSVIKESFRNPFTKFQIIFSFTTSVMFISTIEVLVIQIKKLKIKNKIFFGSLFIFVNILFIFITYWPSFNGQLINEKLKTSIPNEYFDLYKYLNSLPKNERILELPFFSDAGWVYYNWQNQSSINGYKGYQGIGINFFGIKQPYLTPDFSRWQETNDFFYHELRYGLNTKSANLFLSILKKYQVPLVLLDNTMINPTKNYDHRDLKKMIEQSGCLVIWQKNFLTLYRCLKNDPKNDFLIPKKITNISLPYFNRTAKDLIYENYEDYKDSSFNSQSSLTHPFSDLYSYEIKNINLSQNKIIIERNLSPGQYHLFFLNKNFNKTPVSFELKDRQLLISSQRIKILTENSSFDLIPYIPLTNLRLDKNYNTLYIEVDDQKLIIKKNQRKIIFLDISDAKKISIRGINFKENSSSIFFLEDNPLLLNLKLNFPTNKDKIFIKDRIKLITDFFIEEINLSRIISHNCSFPRQGRINTIVKPTSILNQAEDFGVNCNGFELPFLPLEGYSALINIKGKNILGRSIKFFINYEDSNIIDHDYLLPEDRFNSFLNILGTPLNQKIVVNFETRSFGKKSINELDSIRIALLPVDFIGNISLIKRQNSPKKLEEKNNIEIDKIINSPIVKIVKTHCFEDLCYLGINQSYDRLWLAFDEKINPLATHQKLNNWANLWQINKGDHLILIFYLPSIISILCIISLIIFLIRILWVER